MIANARTKCMYDPILWSTGCSVSGVMWSWAIGFLVIALAAALIGFGAGGITPAEIARPVFYAAVALFLVSLLGSFMRRV